MGVNWQIGFHLQAPRFDFEMPKKCRQRLSGRWRYIMVLQPTHSIAQEFQSTLPRGERRPGFGTGVVDQLVSIHAPVKEANA
jgi:hypothetical protein